SSTDETADPARRDLSVILEAVPLDEAARDRLDGDGRLIRPGQEVAEDLEDIGLGIHPALHHELPVVALGELPELRPHRGIPGEAQERHEDLVQARLDGAVDEVLRQRRVTESPEAKQKEL